jgi:uncharacterized protein (DUF305 family)
MRTFVMRWRAGDGLILGLVTLVGYAGTSSQDRCHELLHRGAPTAGDMVSAQRAAFVDVTSACMARMHDAMHAALMAPSGGTDTLFAAAMIAHHQGAIDMAQAELRYGHDQQLRRLAQEIIITQGQEIPVMRLALNQAHSSHAARGRQEP